MCVQTHRLTDRKTDARSCPASRKREGGGEKERERERERESLCAYTQTHRHTDGQTDRQTDTHTHTHTQSHHILDKYEDIDCVQLLKTNIAHTMIRIMLSGLCVFASKRDPYE